MPIYEYRCESCGHELERMQKISDPPLTDCPQCGQPALRKRISAAAFRLKGGGWYETDFKKSNQKNLHDGGGKKDPKSGEGASSAAGASADTGSAKAAASDSGTAAKATSLEKKPAA